MQPYSPPLVVNFIWNCADSGAVLPVLDVVRKSFARDKDKPFSRGLNIPLFYFSSNNPGEIPLNSPIECAKTNILFVFTSENTLGRRSWQEYVEALPASPSAHIVPIAVSRGGLGHGGVLKNLNCIRAYEWPSEDKDLQAVVSLAHEIIRWQRSPATGAEVGKDRSVTIFLSHAKAGDTGRLHAEEIKQSIDKTNMNRFFDATEISPGYRFDTEIEKAIENSTVVAIESDAYSSRYWCQREILCAKKHNRPIVVVNSLSDYEDRIFPAASNVPCVHVSPTSPLTKRDILRILSAAILETVRHSHALDALASFKEEGWIDADCKLSARPPEIRQALAAQETGEPRKLCYPEPPIYSDEADWHSGLKLEAFTPLWSPSEKDAFSAQRTGISISEVEQDGFSSNNIHPDHLFRLAQDISRHLLSRSATLIYGGNLSQDGFTAFILDEAAILQDRLGKAIPKIENHLAWPLYVSEPDIVAWRAKYSHIMKTKEYPIPSDVAAGIPNDIFLSPSGTNNLYIWSRCLTQMRQESVASSTVRICAGGKLRGYKGKMPGVLEEIVIALRLGKPIFLIGAYGGVVGRVCDVLLGKPVSEELTEEWQVANNPGYADLQKLASSHGHGCDYKSIVNLIQTQTLSKLAASCGLEESEYKILMGSPFIDECLQLVIKGIRKMHAP